MSTDHGEIDRMLDEYKAMLASMTPEERSAYHKKAEAERRAYQLANPYKGGERQAQAMMPKAAKQVSFAPPYSISVSSGLDGDKWIRLEAHGHIFASFAVSSWGSEQACIEAAWRYAYELSPADTLDEAVGWKSVDLYDELRDDLVQVLCRVLPDIAGDFPRSSDFPISSGDHAVGDRFVSIGFRGDDGHWNVAGWDMTQDCFTDARLYEVLGWQPLASLPKGGE